MSVTELRVLQTQGLLSPLDVQFALRLVALTDERRGPIPDDQRRGLLLAVAFASRAPRHGHVCVDLARLATTLRAEQKFEDPLGARAPVALPALPTWLTWLAGDPLIGDGEGLTPLVLSGAQLYLMRYHRSQEALVEALQERLAAPDLELDEERVRAGLDAWLPLDQPGGEQRRRACVTALLRPLSVITGGPGTGKTSTAAVLLALLAQGARTGDEGRGELRIALMAPTGKAASRLTAALQAARARLSLPPEVEALLPTEAATVHRTLGYRPGAADPFRYGSAHPLPVDVALLDEASMVDLTLLARLAQAVPSTARFILLGDQEQLASVEAGAILGDLCLSGQKRPEIRTGWRRRLGQFGIGGLYADPESPPMADAVVELQHSWRFSDEGGIGALARAVREGDHRRALSLLRDPARPEVRLEEVSGRDEALRALRRLVTKGLAELGEAGDDPARWLAAYARFGVLSAHRRGPLGLTGLNRSIEAWLAARGWIEPAGGGYPGQPLLVTRNDHALGLFNGDAGVVQREAGGTLAAWFRAPGREGLRPVNLARLPRWEPGFALTVHRSQGSEYDEVVVVLPAGGSRVLTRQLLYTALTRARARVVVVGGAEQIKAAARARVERASGLRQRLWGGASAASSVVALSSPGASLV